jgi:DNA-binding GntR family transcriptional regulator
MGVAGHRTVMIVVDGLDYEAGEPIYLQLAAILRARIRSGDLRPGKLIPSENRLMQEYEVARATARKAVRVLREEGLVYTVQGWGTFVKPRD